ncbi:hypothetical protein M430DRAFT_22658 [Amorphotheca resinae ATCC 22711]|uniref:Uncharacterized protein n=1 Tax=Amorphotheca resinae ATCC 22711 TaxID=857342 RepID=A0A2T3ASE6_AMORE|nr:hypothetical protein M430DRAFT_22658 [Amorphotheca resinae ATCC 22711]PSS09299.1 hypothetical protein M430DRAFT_22658 [Amorphotheca resinae ATCC 22711]
MSHDPPTADLQKKSSCSDNQLELPTRSLSVHHRMWNLITLGANHAASLNCGVTNVCNQCRIDRKEMSGLPLTKISCLRSKTTVGLNATEPGFPGTIIYSGINPNSFQPCIDGKTIPAQPSRVGTKFLLSLSQILLKEDLHTRTIWNYVGNPHWSNCTTFLQDSSGNWLHNSSNSLSAFSQGLSRVLSAMNQIITNVSYFCSVYRAFNVAVKNQRMSILGCGEMRRSSILQRVA